MFQAQILTLKLRPKKALNALSDGVLMEVEKALDEFEVRDHMKITIKVAFELFLIPDQN